MLDSKPDLEQLLAKWKPILRLSDWDIVIGYKRAFDLRPSEQGQCAWTVAKKSAHICVLDPCDYDPSNVWPQDIEKTVVHELVHLHFAIVDDRGELYEKCMEQAVECIAWALIDRDRA